MKKQNEMTLSNTKMDTQKKPRAAIIVVTSFNLPKKQATINLFVIDTIALADYAISEILFDNITKRDEKLILLGIMVAIVYKKEKKKDYDIYCSDKIINGKSESGNFNSKFYSSCETIEEHFENISKHILLEQVSFWRPEWGNIRKEIASLKKETDWIWTSMLY